MTQVVAGLRFPLAFTLGLLLTASLFTLLWVFTDNTFELTETTPLRIEYKRVERETPLETRRAPKVERTPPEAVAVLPPFVGPDTTGPGPVLIPGSEPTLDFDTGFTVAGSDRQAVPLVRVDPVYPARAASNGIEGWVRVQFDITAAGSVTNVVAVESEPGSTFDAAAVQAVQRWRYNPSVVDGRAVERIGMQTLIRFTLEGEE